MPQPLYLSRLYSYRNLTRKRNSTVCRLRRKQILGATHAVDRSRLRYVNYDRDRARSAASRSAFGLDRASIAWDDRKRATPGLGPGALQLGGIRKRDRPRLGSAQPTENNSLRGESMKSLKAGSDPRLFRYTLP